MNLEYQDYLAHHGIKGQKWGVRRYQNEDGTYTDAGKRRRGFETVKQLFSAGTMSGPKPNGVPNYPGVKSGPKPNGVPNYPGVKSGPKSEKMPFGARSAIGGSINRPKSESSTWKAKEAGTLSDEELRKRLTRLQQEKQYKEMTASKATKARKWIGKTAGKILVTTAIGAASGIMAGKYKDIFNSQLPVLVNAIKPKK